MSDWISITSRKNAQKRNKKKQLSVAFSCSISWNLSSIILALSSLYYLLLLLSFSPSTFAIIQRQAGPLRRCSIPITHINQSIVRLITHRILMLLERSEYQVTDKVWRESTIHRASRPIYTSPAIHSYRLLHPDVFTSPFFYTQATC